MADRHASAWHRPVGRRSAACHRGEQIGAPRREVVAQVLVDVLGDRADDEVSGQVGDCGGQSGAQHLQVADLAQRRRVPLELVLEGDGLLGVETMLERAQRAAQAARRDPGVVDGFLGVADDREMPGDQRVALLADVVDEHGARGGPGCADPLVADSDQGAGQLGPAGGRVGTGSTQRLADRREQVE